MSQREKNIDEKVRFFVDKIYVVNLEEIHARLVSGESVKEVEVKKTDKFDYTISFDHAVSEEDLLNGLVLKLEGRDSQGNVILKEETVPILEENPELMVAVLHPPVAKREYAFGQLFSVTAKLLSSARLGDEKIRLECEQLGLSEEMEFDEFRKEFHYELLLPEVSSGLDHLDFKLVGTGKIKNRGLMDVEYFRTSLSRELLVEFVSPTEEERLWFDDFFREVSVSVRQPNGFAFKKNSLEAELEVNGVKGPVLLVFNSVSGIFDVVLSEPLPADSYVLSIRIVGDYSGAAFTESRIIKEDLVYNSALVVGVAVPVIVLVAVFIFFYGNMRAEKKHLLEEKSRLLGLKKKFKFEFFKRHINQKEFSDGNKQLELGLKKIDSLIFGGAWVKAGIIRTVYRTSNPKKLPLRFQSSLLLNRIASHRGEFSSVEVSRALRAEGYSDGVVDRVIELLYGKQH